MSRKSSGTQRNRVLSIFIKSKANKSGSNMKQDLRRVGPRIDIKVSRKATDVQLVSHSARLGEKWTGAT